MAPETKDILSDIDILNDTTLDNFHTTEVSTYTLDTITSFSAPGEEKNMIFKVYKTTIFISKYLFTSAAIFTLLLISSNYKAYYEITKSYVFASDFKEQEQSLINSVEASNLNGKDKKQEGTGAVDTSSLHSMRKLVSQIDEDTAHLDIDITPFENRIVIPKIGKNIPLMEVTDTTVESQQDLQDIFMKELENGVVRYPGSVTPGNEGVTFVFGHSSNFPWVKGDYNDVFALLDKLSSKDEIIVYFNSKKYVYTIKEKKVIKPGDVSVLKRNKGKNELSLMTCWPIGTTFNRLVVTGELTESN